MRSVAELLFFGLRQRIHGSSFPRYVCSEIAGPDETKNPAGKSPPPDSDPFNGV